MIILHSHPLNSVNWPQIPHMIVCSHRLPRAFVCFGGVGLRLPGGPAVLRFCFQSVWHTMPEDVALVFEGDADVH